MESVKSISGQTHILPAGKPAIPPQADQMNVQDTVSPDMAQMLEDIERVYPGYIKKPVTENDSPADKTTSVSYVSPDTARMVDDIERHREQTETAVTAKGKEKPVSDIPVFLQEEFPVAPAIHEDKKSPGKKGESEHNHHTLSSLLTGAHLGLEGMEAGGLIVQGSEEAAHTGGEAAVSEASSHIATEGAAIGTSLSGAMVGGIIGSAVVATLMTALGVRDIRNGVRKKDREKILEGSAKTILGTKSAAAGISIAAHGAREGLFATMANAAHAVLMPLGVAHGAIDTTPGIGKIYKGTKTHNKGEILEGILEVGQGASIGLAATCAGVPAIIAALGFLGARMIYHHHRSKNSASTHN